MDFTNKRLWLLFRAGDTNVYATESMLAAWIISAVVIVFAVAVRLRLTKFKDVPRGLQNVLEALVETMEKLTRNTMGKELSGFGAYFFSIFAFILLSNYSGMFGLRAPTSDLAVTVSLALSTFIIIHVLGIMRQRGRYFKEYLAPMPLFLPLNIVGELAKPVSLSFRLFGNILGGTIIMGLLYEMLPRALQFLLPSVLHAYFDLFAGALQAFIFTVLSMTFIQQKAVLDD